MGDDLMGDAHKEGTYYEYWVLSASYESLNSISETNTTVYVS